MVDTRVTYRRRLSYNTTSNQVRKVRTPGGRYTVHYITKRGKVPSCGDCGCKLIGLPASRPFALSRLSKTQKTVSRSYGGSRCGGCVRDRIVRAFLLEEQKLVKNLAKQHAAASKAAEKKGKN
ncbi:50S ribosomal protein L34e [Fonticula alba]|uniref:50S ribosomal protein L34e n=1 Tax=Fonticula alba TaxID=691883 RepID=A0A058Z510_FONAL|nr:50S ribosomal protein L34e [Fonticula alba]KCV69369.1 50S ribosomal protein L34e [Fonticula alba]|eukprot:XP_009495934.1 50S ribosomal protein L34e [Fonticula alba]